MENLISKNSPLEQAKTENVNLLTEKQAAERLQLSPATLQVWRCTRRVNLPFVKVGRLVRYRAEDLQAFIDSNLNGSQSEACTGGAA